MSRLFKACDPLESHCDAIVYDIFFYRAPPVLFFHALVTGQAPTDFLASKLKQFRPYSLVFKFSEHMIDQNGRISVLASASAKSH